MIHTNILMVPRLIFINVQRILFHFKSSYMVHRLHLVMFQCTPWQPDIKGRPKRWRTLFDGLIQFRCLWHHKFRIKGPYAHYEIFFVLKRESFSMKREKKNSARIILQQVQKKTRQQIPSLILLTTSNVLIVDFVIVAEPHVETEGIDNGKAYFCLHQKFAYTFD